MEPKTKIQKKVVELSGKLKPITQQHKNWAYARCLDKYFVRHRHTNYCLECGHSWNDGLGSLISAICGATCPACGSELKKCTSYEREYRESAYFAIIDTIKDMQVVRMILVVKRSKKRNKAELFASEVMQHWIDEQGRITSLSKNVQGLSRYYDQWIHESNLEVRLRSERATLRNGIGPYKIYPGRKVLKIIKRNGYKGHFYNYTPQSFFSLILTDPCAETLLKSGQIELFKTVKTRDIKKYWPSIRICIRNNYKVNDASVWFDYVDLLSHFRKDIRNSGYICPNNLKLSHDRLLKKKMTEEKRLKMEEMKERLTEEQAEYSEHIVRFVDLHFCKGSIEIKPLDTVEEIMNEGEELHHCVFANNYHKKHNSLLLSARVNSKRVETIEISLKSFEIVQARGVNNQASKFHSRILELVESNIDHIKAKINQNV